MSQKGGRALLNLIQQCAGLEAQEMKSLVEEHSRRSGRSIDELTIDDMRHIAHNLLQSVHVEMTRDIEGPEDEFTYMPEA